MHRKFSSSMCNERFTINHTEWQLLEALYAKQFYWKPGKPPAMVWRRFHINKVRFVDVAALWKNIDLRVLHAVFTCSTLQEGWSLYNYFIRLVLVSLINADMNTSRSISSLFIFFWNSSIIWWENRSRKGNTTHFTTTECQLNVNVQFTEFAVYYYAYDQLNCVPDNLIVLRLSCLTTFNIFLSN